MIDKYVFNVENIHDWTKDESFVSQIGQNNLLMYKSAITPDGPFAYRDTENIEYISEDMRGSFQNYINFASDLYNAEVSNIQKMMDGNMATTSETPDEFNGHYRVLPITHKESTKAKKILIRHSHHGKRILGLGTYHFIYPVTNPGYQLLKPLEMDFIHDITDVFSDMDQRLFFRMYDLYFNSMMEIIKRGKVWDNMVKR